MSGLDIQIEIKRRGLRQADVAQKVGYDPTHFSKLLTGAYANWPENFEQRCLDAIDSVAQEQIRKLQGAAA